MEEELMLKLLANIGVPAAVCFYTLYGVNQTLQKQDTTLKGLTDAINKLTTDVDRRLDKQEDETRRLQATVTELNRTVNTLQHRRE